MSKNTTMYKRSGLRWSVSEVLDLQREYELLSLDIEEISKRHKRTPCAIAMRLINEEFATQEQVDVAKYLGKKNISFTTSKSDESSYQQSDNESDSNIDTISDTESEIATLKGQVSDLNGKIDSILEMLRRSNGGSVIGTY